MDNKKELDEFLLKQRMEAEERDAQRKAKEHNLNYVNLISIKTPTEIDALRLVNKEQAQEALLSPIKIIKKKLTIAVYNPENKKANEIIEELSKKYNITVVVVSRSSLKHTWEFYQHIIQKGGNITGSINISPQRIEYFKIKINHLKNLSEETTNMKNKKTSEIMEIILGGAIALKASDIHIEPNEKKSSIRLRMNGMLHLVSDTISTKQQESLVTRIKLLSNLKLNIKDEAQDGRFTIKLPSRKIEIRISVIPSEYGETVVMRLLDPNALKVNLTELGWREDDLKIIQNILKQPHGLILNTGPTGSGKTTTLYAFLRNKITPKIKIITIEDPIEYHLDGISQTQTDPEAGYTFASGLRSILRQDPDIILVGEIRDAETAKIAINASLTGHMVFSTLHTNHAIGAIPRLLDLGSKSNVLGPAISIIIAQRLPRKLCDNCKIKKEIDSTTKEKINSFLKQLPNRVNINNYRNPTIYKANPNGCEKCNNTGYKGRTSIFELFTVTDEIKKEIYKNPTETELQKIARKEGMVFMQEDGVLKVIKGITSFEEIERLTGSIQW